MTFLNDCLWRISGLAASFVICLLITGCGGRVYEGRVEETKKYFEFIEKQNVNLAKTWTGSGMSFRTPNLFQLMPAPKIVKDKEGKIVSEEEDKRQPEFMEDGLPGLISAWKSEFAVPNSKDKRTAYLYLLSNYDLWLEAATKKEDAEKFHALAVGRITQGLKTPRPADDKWITERFPRGESYIDQKAFTVASLSPSPEIDGNKYDATIYLAKNGDIQVALLYLMPQNVQPGRLSHFQEVSPNEKMALALETFTTQGKAPTKGKPGAPAGGGGAPARGPF